MKTLLFIVLKVLEIIAYLLFCLILGLFLDWIGLCYWIDDAPLWVLITISAIGFILTIIWLILNFQPWINLNKKWVNQILKK